ncbi:MAG: cupin-like domain-containing protein [Rudaea sp.]|uniref:cupin-like domain-containing protein n=1 Tax=Rudaea sp. TaxID=2136325 RepID=UPI0039E44F63
MSTAIEEIRVEDDTLDLREITQRAQPLVLRGLCRDWPLVALAKQSDTAFAQELARHDNGTPVDVLLLAPEANGAIGYDAALDGFNYEHFRVSVTDALKRLAAYAREESSPRGVALQSAPLAQCVPGLVATHRVPFLDASVQPRLWLGNRVTTPAHFDSTHNIAVVACGRRRFTLFPPDQVGNLYVGPLDSAPTAAAIGMAPLNAADDPRWPRLHTALAHAQSAELRPGDAIYIPPVWWHHVASLERLNALVNFWWRTDGVTESGLHALMHCLLAYKSMPAAERAAWRTLLDHYVFGSEDPVTHIPPGRRGVLGPLTPELVAWLKQWAQPRP